MKGFIFALQFFLALNSVLSLRLEKTVIKNDKLVVCYFGSWAVYRPEPGKFDVENIDPNLCTHAIYGFAGLTNDYKIRALDEWNDLEENWGKNAYGRFINMKQRNPNLKVLLAIGGWNEGSEKYSDMVLTRERRQIFIDSVLAMFESYKFDGLDLDWEYPANRGGRPEDKANFALLCSEMRAVFAPRGWILSAAVSAGPDTIDTAYDIPSVCRDLDFINIMAYDYHGAWANVTGHHTPLYGHPLDSGDEANFNTHFSANYWANGGCPREKLIIGMGSYGRGWILQTMDQSGAYAPTTGAIPAGPYTREAGFWGYHEICDAQRSGQWTEVTEPNYQAPYAYNPSNRYWVGYDSIASITLKSNWLAANEFGGGMLWSLETDDFGNWCGMGRYPLLTTMYNILGGDYVPPTTTSTTRDPSMTTVSTIAPEPTSQPPQTPPPTGPTTERPPDHEVCKHEGSNPDPNGNCAYFYRCDRQGNGWLVTYQDCPPGTLFDRNVLMCVHADQVSHPCPERP